MAARLAFFIDSGEMLERQSDVSQAPPWPYWPPNMPVTAPPSATPEGGERPDARTLARRIVLALNDQHRLAGYTEDEVALVIAFVEQDRARRDALHAETERVMREALTQIAEYEIDWREGPGYNVGVLQQRAEDALATAQAMKEGTP